jgi:hypothetical protein
MGLTALMPPDSAESDSGSGHVGIRLPQSRSGIIYPLPPSMKNQASDNPAKLGS